MIKSNGVINLTSTFFENIFILYFNVFLLRKYTGKVIICVINKPRLGAIFFISRVFLFPRKFNIKFKNKFNYFGKCLYQYRWLSFSFINASFLPHVLLKIFIICLKMLKRFYIFYHKLYLHITNNLLLTIGINAFFFKYKRCFKM